MIEIPVLLTLIGGALALAALVLLWKLIVTTAVIGLVQWAVVANLPDQPGVMVAAFAVPALLAALTLTRAFPSARPVSRRLAMAGSSHARRKEHLR